MENLEIEFKAWVPIVVRRGRGAPRGAFEDLFDRLEEEFGIGLRVFCSMPIKQSDGGCTGYTCIYLTSHSEFNALDPFFGIATPGDGDSAKTITNIVA